jgi:hypothetical protein
MFSHVIGTALDIPQEMHWSDVDAVYAFRSQSGDWFGPHAALPRGEFTDGTLHLKSAQSANPFAGQILTMRFGPQGRDVSAHTCQVTLPGGTQRRVRVTHTVLDFMLSDGQTPLRRAMTDLTRAALGNSQIPAQLQTMIAQAGRAMNLGVPVEQLAASVDKVDIDGVRRVVALVGDDADDEHVADAIHCLEWAAMKYFMWLRTRGR